MILSVFIIIFLLSGFFGNAQKFLVVTAKEGAANIRNWNLEKTKKALKNNTVVFWEDEYDGPGYSEGWLAIKYAKDAFHKNAEETSENLEAALVHQSQATDLEKLKKVGGKEFSVRYTTQKFNFKNKKIVWGEGKQYIKTVNGKNLFGADCGLPKTEIVKAEATINGKKIKIDDALLTNILGATNGRFQYYKKGNTYFAVQENGDGACFYYVVWVFENGKLVQRLGGNLY